MRASKKILQRLWDEFNHVIDTLDAEKDNENLNGIVDELISDTSNMRELRSDLEKIGIKIN